MSYRVAVPACWLVVLTTSLVEAEQSQQSLDGLGWVDMVIKTHFSFCDLIIPIIIVLAGKAISI